MKKTEEFIKTIWDWVTSEKNNRGLTLIVLTAGFIFGLMQIRDIGINLKNIQADSIETRNITSPKDEKLNIGLTKEGLPAMQLDSSAPQPILQLGSSEFPQLKACIQVKLPNSIEFVHVSPHKAGTPVIWEEGECSD